MQAFWGPVDTVPSPKYDMDAHMAISFGGETLDLC